MGFVCCVKGCGNKTRGNIKGISFHSLPLKGTLWRQQLLKSLKLQEKDLEKWKTPKICSVHFPTSDIRDVGCFKKLRKNAVPTLILPTIGVENVEENQDKEYMENYKKNAVEENSLQAENALLHNKLETMAKEVMTLKEEVATLKRQYKLLQANTAAAARNHPEVSSSSVKKVFSINMIKDNDAKMLYYTGLPSYQIYRSIFEFILPSEKACSDLPIFSPKKRKSRQRRMKLCPEEQLFLVLLRIRRSVDLEFLSDLFNITTSTVDKIFVCWINLLYVNLGSLNVWPHRDVLIENAPHEFQEKYPNVVGSIDCTEFLCERPSSLLRQSQCYSNYKSSTTLKSLVMTDPNGHIIFCSQLMTGSMSDKQIVMESGFLDTIKRKISQKELLPGDVILADKGFNIQDLFSHGSIDINIPTFRISGMQFTAADVENTRKIAKERVHVERAIGRIKKFKILRNIVPVSLMGSINQIHMVCCMLTNFRYQLCKQ